MFHEVQNYQPQSWHNVSEEIYVQVKAVTITFCIITKEEIAEYNSQSALVHHQTSVLLAGTGHN